MKYVATGDLDWSDWGPIAEFVRLLAPGDQVAHGAATRGLDSMLHWMLTNPRASARRARKVYTYGEDGTIGQRREGNARGDVDVNLFPANWERYKPRDAERTNPAGIIRNEWMMRIWHPDRVVWFARSLEGAPGARHLVGLARERGIDTLSVEEFIESHKSYEAEEEY